MKKVIGYLIAGVIGYAGGVFTGYILRKKTSEVAFEEISEEEQVAQIMADQQEPVNAKQEIDNLFAAGREDIRNEVDHVAQMDTQKVQYLKMWKANEAMDKYDTRTKEDPEDAVTTDENLEEGLDHEFLSEISTEKVDNGARPNIEPASIEDWEHWNNMQDEGPNDAEYDCVQVLWFKDGVLTDEEGTPLENPGKYIGFDVAEKFREIDEYSTGDPDIRIVYNHSKGAIYQIVRKHCDYNRKRGMEEFGSEYGGEDDYEE